LTLFLTLTGALVVAVLHPSVEQTPFEHACAVLGFIVAVLFFLLEERATYYRRRFVEFAKRIEASRSPTIPPMYHATRNPCELGSDWIYRIFFAVVAGLWATILLKAPLLGVVSGLAALLLFCRVGSFMQSRPIDDITKTLLSKSLPHFGPEDQPEPNQEATQSSEHSSAKTGDQAHRN